MRWRRRSARGAASHTTRTGRRAWRARARATVRPSSRRFRTSGCRRSTRSTTASRLDPPGSSSIAIARAYPSVEVDGFDADDTSIQMARDHALEAGIADRVRFHLADAVELTSQGPFDVATAFECIHDMARPVEVLGAVREALVDDGAMLVVDERTKDAFSGEPDDREAYFYGWSVFDCLPTGMYEQPSAGTGTVMRASTLRGYANEAGFTRFDVLPIEHDAFRLYLLRP